MNRLEVEKKKIIISKSLQDTIMLASFKKLKFVCV